MNLILMLLMMMVTIAHVQISVAELRHDFAGTAELLPAGNSRRSRLSPEFIPSETDPTSQVRQDETTPAAAHSTLSDDTVREYGHLLQMDTKNFSEKQKALFERIVERVARLSSNNGSGGGGGGGQENATNAAANVNEGRGTKNRLKKNSLKTISVTPRPTKHTVASATTIAGSDSPMTKVTTMIKAKPSVTIQTTSAADVVNKVHTKLQAAALAAAAAAARNNVTEVIFGNITTSSIVDSLSADNNVPREDIYVVKRPAATVAAVAAAAATAASSIDSTKVKVSLCDFIAIYDKLDTSNRFYFILYSSYT